MNRVIANFKNECDKLLSRKKYLVFLIIELVICVGVVCMKLLSARISRGAFTMSNINTSLSVMSLFLEAIIPFISIMAVCELFSGEFRDKTIRASLMRPCDRYKIFIGKVGAVFALAVVNMAAVMISSNAADLIVTGRIANLGYSIGAYVLDTIPMLVVILMAVMINQFTKSSTMAMFLCIIIYAGLKIAGIHFSSLSGLMFTGFMQWHKIWLGGGMPYLAASFKALLLIGYAMTFTAIGYYAFRFKES